MDSDIQIVTVVVNVLGFQMQIGLGITNDRKSTSGYMFMLNEGPITKPQWFENMFSLRLRSTKVG